MGLTLPWFRNHQANAHRWNTFPSYASQTSTGKLSAFWLNQELGFMISQDAFPDACNFG